jgi:hypothetical protein
MTMDKQLEMRVNSAMENACDLLEDVTRHYKENHPGLINHDANRDRIKIIEQILKGAALINHDEYFHESIKRNKPLEIQ